MANPADDEGADQILWLERGALDRWGAGDSGGLLELYAPDITYFDPMTAARIDGHQAMVEYYRPLPARSASTATRCSTPMSSWAATWPS